MIIGREPELKILNNIWQSAKAELIALYGRRRIGKTFLVRECFENKKSCVYVEITGVHKSGIKKQLQKFSKSVSEVFFNGTPLKISDNWDEAFDLLTNEMGAASVSKKSNKSSD